MTVVPWKAVLSQEVPQGAVGLGADVGVEMGVSLLRTLSLDAE